jgi:hypothetical protein
MKNRNSPQIKTSVTRSGNPRIEVDDLPMDLLYPCTYRILIHLHQRGFTAEHKAAVLQVFGDLILEEIGTDPEELLDLAEQMERSFRGSQPELTP